MKTWCVLWGRGRRALTFPPSRRGAPAPQTPSHRPAPLGWKSPASPPAPTRPQTARGPGPAPRSLSGRGCAAREDREQRPRRPPAPGSAPLARPYAAATGFSTSPRRHSPLPCAPGPRGCSGWLRRSGCLLAQQPAPQGPGVRAPGAEVGARDWRPGLGRRPALSAAATYSAAAAACAPRRSRPAPPLAPPPRPKPAPPPRDVTSGSPGKRGRRPRWRRAFQQRAGPCTSSLPARSLPGFAHAPTLHSLLYRVFWKHQSRNKRSARADSKTVVRFWL